jgi:hypothetical protein
MEPNFKIKRNYKKIKPPLALPPQKKKKTSFFGVSI